MLEFLSADVFFEIGLYLLVLVFLVHAIVFAYHWLSFGADRSTSLLGIVIYVAGGVLLLSTLLGAWLMM